MKAHLLVGQFGSVIAEGTKQECEFAKEALISYGIKEDHIWGVFPAENAILNEEGNVEDIISWEVVVSDLK